MRLKVALYLYHWDPNGKEWCYLKYIYIMGLSVHSHPDKIIIATIYKSNYCSECNSSLAKPSFVLE